MQEVDEGEGYSDDDLDALPADAFQELQQNAIRSTQQQDQNERVEVSFRRDQGLPGAQDLGRGMENSALSGNAFCKTPIHVRTQQASSDYGEFDDEMLDGEIFDAGEESVLFQERMGGFTAPQIGENTQRDLWLKQRFDVPLRPQNRAAGLLSLPPQSLATPQTRYGLKGNNHDGDEHNASATYEGIRIPQAQSEEESSNIKNLEDQVRQVCRVDRSPSCGCPSLNLQVASRTGSTPSGCQLCQ